MSCLIFHRSKQLLGPRLQKCGRTLVKSVGNYWAPLGPGPKPEIGHQFNYSSPPVPSGIVNQGEFLHPANPGDYIQVSIRDIPGEDLTTQLLQLQPGDIIHVGDPSQIDYTVAGHPLFDGTFITVHTDNPGSIVGGEYKISVTRPYS